MNKLKEILHNVQKDFTLTQTYMETSNHILKHITNDNTKICQDLTKTIILMFKT